jgi:hypothetical protein
MSGAGVHRHFLGAKNAQELAKKIYYIYKLYLDMDLERNEYLEKKGTDNFTYLHSVNKYNDSNDIKITGYYEYDGNDFSEEALQSRREKQNSILPYFKSKTLKSKTLKSKTLKSKTLKSKSLKSKTLKSKTLKSKTLKSKNLKSKNLKSKTL